MNLLFKEYLAVAFGGAFGSMMRFGVSRWIQSITHHTDYPWGIFVVNVSGCFVMGILYGFLIHRLALGPLWRAGILIGILGGYTTFSSFSMDTIVLLQSGAYSSAALNAILSLICCLVATTLGLILISSIT